jgi:hypothetical protein
MNAAVVPLKTLVFIAAALAFFPARAASQEKGAETYVAIAASASRDTIAPGSGADILFTFNPKKGFHVNAVPPMAVRFDTTAPAKNGGSIVIPADTATGYLKTSRPVRQPFTLRSSAKKGRTELKGALTYYYCSETEGWCRKETLRFAVALTVK